jgi:hypothetical protein
METAEQRERYESRGPRTALGEPGVKGLRATRQNPTLDEWGSIEIEDQALASATYFDQYGA